MPEETPPFLRPFSIPPIGFNRPFLPAFISSVFLPIDKWSLAVSPFWRIAPFLFSLLCSETTTFFADAPTGTRRREDRFSASRHKRGGLIFPRGKRLPGLRHAGRVLVRESYLCGKRNSIFNFFYTPISSPFLYIYLAGFLGWTHRYPTSAGINPFGPPRGILIPYQVGASFYGAAGPDGSMSGRSSFNCHRPTSFFFLVYGNSFLHVKSLISLIFPFQFFPSTNLHAPDTLYFPCSLLLAVKSFAAPSFYVFTSGLAFIGPQEISVFFVEELFLFLFFFGFRLPLVCSTRKDPHFLQYYEAHSPISTDGSFLAPCYPIFLDKKMIPPGGRFFAF